MLNLKKQIMKKVLLIIAVLMSVASSYAQDVVYHSTSVEIIHYTGDNIDSIEVIKNLMTFKEYFDEGKLEMHEAGGKLVFMLSNPKDGHNGVFNYDVYVIDDDGEKVKGKITFYMKNFRNALIVMTLNKGKHSEVYRFTCLSEME